MTLWMVLLILVVVVLRGVWWFFKPCWRVWRRAKKQGRTT